MNYLTINKEELENKFEIKELNSNLFELRSFGGVNKIIIRLPFELNEDLASLAGLMPDGSLIKDLRRIYFFQKKDISKIYLFKNLIYKLFLPNNKIFIREHKFDVYTNSQTLVHFLHFILDFSKSNEQMRVPSWIFQSPDHVKRAYLKQAFDMESYLNKRLQEIRFITKDQDYALGLQKLLKSLNINAIVKTRLGGTHNTLQYRVSIYGRDNFKEFKKIGFDIPLHKERFNRLIKKYKI